MANDLIITGIPRSGTSYICSILNEVENVVVINEPNEVFQLMRSSSDVPMAKYYESIRNRISNNLPITNKIIDGKFIEDTNVVDASSEYIPDVDSNKFILGTKNTLVYLCSLERLQKQFPNDTIIACIRHPVDTIASWVNVKFPHIQNVEVNFLMEYADDATKKSIQRVMNKSNLAQRYAMWWDCLAKVILKSSSKIVVVRYEDMVVNPQKTINDVCGAASFEFKMKKNIEPSEPRSHRDKLSSEIIEFINQYCKNSATKFNYKL